MHACFARHAINGYVNGRDGEQGADAIECSLDCTSPNGWDDNDDDNAYASEDNAFDNETPSPAAQESPLFFPDSPHDSPHLAQHPLSPAASMITSPAFSIASLPDDSTEVLGGSYASPSPRISPMPAVSILPETTPEITISEPFLDGTQGSIFQETTNRTTWLDRIRRISRRQTGTSPAVSIVGDNLKDVANALTNHIAAFYRHENPVTPAQYGAAVVRAFAFEKLAGGERHWRV